MIAEELDLNPFLEAHGIEPVETDLGEYIVQLAGERPSHIIAPACPQDAGQVADLFREKHGNGGRRAERIADLVEEARRACARAISPPTSASPAPTSWSPRPAPAWW